MSARIVSNQWAISVPRSIQTGARPWRRRHRRRPGMPAGRRQRRHRRACRHGFLPARATVITAASAIEAVTLSPVRPHHRRRCSATRRRVAACARTAQAPAQLPSHSRPGTTPGKLPEGEKEQRAIGSECHSKASHSRRNLRLHLRRAAAGFAAQRWRWRWTRARATEDRTMPQVTLIEAVTQALAYEMRRTRPWSCWARIGASNGGVFRATVGLQEKFGPERVIDTPLRNHHRWRHRSLAAQGMKPVAEAQFRLHLPDDEHIAATDSRACARAPAAASPVRRCGAPWAAASARRNTTANERTPLHQHPACAWCCPPSRAPTACCWRRSAIPTR